MRTTFCARSALSLLVVTLACSLAACGNKSEKKPASQVAAKVNSEEISVHQINFVLGRSNAAAISPEQAPAVRREILDKLIDQQLAVEKAVEKKLDRSPDVMMAIDAARREILSRAYLEQIAAAQPKPTPEESKKYISEHPQLFAERRIYNIQEIVMPPSSGTAASLNEMVASGKSLEDVAVWLKSKDIKFSGGSATRPAEQIPLDLLPKLHTLKDGQSLVLENEKSITVMRVVASQSAPVTEEVAIPRVQQFLSNQRSNEAAQNEIKQIKEKAQITMLGEFANTESVPAPQAKTADAEKKPETNAAIEKGVAGLK